jgi:hypothetical protein
MWVTCVPSKPLPSVLESGPVASQITNKKAEAPSSASFIRLVDVAMIASDIYLPLIII